MPGICTCSGLLQGDQDSRRRWGEMNIPLSPGYADLLSWLGQGANFPSLGDVRTGWPPGAISTDVQELGTFVSPDIVVDPQSQASQPKVLVVSAPAAVGKTELAKSIAARTGNPLWDLSKFNVGSNFFSGTLVKAYGGAGYARFEAALRENRAALVLDATDEALGKAGRGNFGEAINDLGYRLGSAEGSRASAGLLGRPESVTFPCVNLAEAGLPWGLLDVSFFAEPHSREF